MSRPDPFRAAGLALAAALLIAATAPNMPAATAQRSAFAAAFVEALHSQDAARVTANYHPAVRACMTPQTRAFFDVIVADDLRNGRRIGAYKLTALKPVTGPPALMGLPADGFAYPVAPTHEMQVETKTGPTSAFVLLRYLAPASGRWYVVYPCPNARGMQFMARRTEERERQIDEGRKLAASLPPELRRELSGLLAKGHLIDAIARYRQATGADDQSAHRVMAALEAAQ
ncbi:MAG TPA: hypothetical protein VLI41_16495 [Phenylobacterium sp.]|uniref:hypothetical protein n=1 Tax=Phenylobacterium sp. TaxID=1871053 RepID=UPI002CCA4ACD|nr:hypothetical protein [Phenylobacterium sp.]HSV04797.1 hypothetical protein [Phenylobacterium sp.]